YMEKVKEENKLTKIKMENPPKKKGRKPLGEKKKIYKTIGIRVEIEHFEQMNKIVEEKFGVSIHTFLGRNLSDIFDKLVPNLYTEQEMEDVVPVQVSYIEKENKLGAEVIKHYYDFLCNEREEKRKKIKEIDSKILELSKLITKK
ncbi:MAG: hypothetical protein ACRCZH_02025, partial [Cetobacterium sp.]